MQNLVMVWKTNERWFYDCRRCHYTDSRSDWPETFKLGNVHAARHINVGFGPGKI